MCSLLHLNRGEGILHSAPKSKLSTQTIKLNAIRVHNHSMLTSYIHMYAFAVYVYVDTYVCI